MSRVFYVHLIKDDFESTSNNSWISPTIDLYDNPSYANYSTVKSNYGLQDLSATWIGLWRRDSETWEDLAAFTWSELINHTWEQIEKQDTSSGFIINNRFVDTTGPIDIVSYNVLNTAASVSTDFYCTDLAEAQFPVEWALEQSVTPADPITIIGSHRYLKIVCNFPVNPGNDTEVFIRVEIGSPVIDAKFVYTDNILDKFPQWMAIHEDPSVTAATPELSTPTSLAGSFINLAAGHWLDDINNQIVYKNLQHYVSTVDLNQKAWVYKVNNVPDYIYSVEGDGQPVGQAVSARELYESLDSEHVFWWDEDTKTVYLSQLYNTLKINGVTYIQSPHQIWNWVDELGLAVDLYRTNLEDNESFRHRISDVYVNRPGVGLESFKLALRRELNLWKHATPYQTLNPKVLEFPATPPVTPATPNSIDLGATPTILEMSDIEEDSKYMGLDGIPTSLFATLVDDLSKQYPTLWGRFRWDRAIWDIGGVEGEGFKGLPGMFDATPVLAADTQGGIGDGNDLYVYRPDAITGPHDFLTQLKVRGKHRVTETHYVPTQLDVSVYGRADRRFYTNPTTTIWLTLEVQAFNGLSPGTTYSYPFQLSAKSDVDVNRPNASVSSYGVLRIFNPDSGLKSSIVLRNKTTGVYFAKRMLAKDIYQIRLKNGKWDFIGQNFTNITNTDIFTAWFSDDPADTLAYNAGTPTLSGDAATPSILPQAAVVLKSKQTSSAVSKWTSEPVPYSIIINGAVPNTSQQPYTLTMPTIAWDNYLETVPNKEYVVSITSTNGAASPTFGGTVYDTNPYFIGSSYFAVNGNNVWTSGNTKILPGNTTSAIFTVNSGALYPVTGYYWSLFETAQTHTISGIVDENGPWHNATAPAPGNSNFVLYSQAIGRSDFGIPNNDANYEISWIGVDVLNDDQVIGWLDTNVVTEVNNSFGFITVRTKLLKDPSPEWNPQINSGWFYEGDEEYYFYARPVTEYIGSRDSLLQGIVRQGAPVIARTNDGTPRELRQVAFSETDPVALTLTNTEYVYGNGSNQLFLTYPDIYNVNVEDTLTNDTLIIEQDLFNNLSFETGDTIGDYWEPYNFGGATATYSISKTQSHVGNQSQKITVTTSGSQIGIKQTSVFEPFRNGAIPIELSFWMKQTVGLPFPKLLLKAWFKGTLAWQQSLSFATVGDITQWKQYVLSTHIPAAFDTLDAFIIFENAVIGDQIYVDDIECRTDNSCVTNVVTLTENTVDGRIYKITYKLRGSFYVENDYLSASPAGQFSHIVFDATPTDYHANNYAVTYESSVFNPATPVDLPLSPLFTTLNEEFIFISHEENPLNQLQVNLSPSTLIADGKDYLLVTMYSLDQYGNPKPNQSFTLSSTFGTFDNTSVTTDRDGFAVARLTAGASSGVVQGTITIAGTVSASINFDISLAESQPYKLMAVVNADEIPASTPSTNIVYGRIESATTHQGKSFAFVNWKKARSIYDLYQGAVDGSGQVMADSSGVFTVGPFHATPPSGYWFVSMDSNTASPADSFAHTGDVVFWYEYPPSTAGVNKMTGLPQAPIQLATPVSRARRYSTKNQYPAYYNEATPNMAATPVTPDWLPPVWYPIDRYQQYQLGILGATPNMLDPTQIPNIHPSFGEM